LSRGDHSTFCAEASHEVATKGSAAGRLPHLAMADVGENVKSDAIGMAMVREEVGLKWACFLESGV
jgi:hypothetical protein